MRREGKGVEVGLVGKGQMTQGLADQVKKWEFAPSARMSFWLT